MKKAILLLLSSISATAGAAGFGLDAHIEGIRPLTFDKPDLAFSIRFTAPQDLPLQSIALFCFSADQAPAMQLSVMPDKGGKPHGKVLARASLVPAAGAWSVFQFGDISLIRGRSYHALLEHDANRGGSHPVGIIDKEHAASFTSTAPAEVDGQLLVRQHGTWKTFAAKPVFIARGHSGQTFGNSYSHGGAADIHGNASPEDPSDDLWQAQALHFLCGTQARSLRVRIRKVGQPAAPLVLELLKHVYASHTTVSLFSTQVAAADAASSQWQWIQVKLPGQTPVPFPPECHYFALRSTAGRPAGASCADCWQVSWAGADPGAQGAEDLTFDGGAHRSRAAWSLSGRRWTDHFNRDLNLVVESAPCAEAAPLVLEPIPTPEFIP